MVFLAFDGDRPVGIANCFLGFSTFRARPLVNIHDLHVLPSHQRRGVGRRLLEAVEARARALDCCKLTLEVQEGNVGAQALYASFGFEEARYGDAGAALFRVKALDATRTAEPSV